MKKLISTIYLSLLTTNLTLANPIDPNNKLQILIQRAKDRQSGIKLEPLKLEEYRSLPQFKKITPTPETCIPIPEPIPTPSSEPLPILSPGPTSTSKIKTEKPKKESKLKAKQEAKIKARKLREEARLTRKTQKLAEQSEKKKQKLAEKKFQQKEEIKPELIKEEIKEEVKEEVTEESNPYLKTQETPSPVIEQLSSDIEAITQDTNKITTRIDKPEIETNTTTSNQPETLSKTNLEQDSEYTKKLQQNLKSLEQEPWADVKRKMAESLDYFSKEKSKYSGQVLDLCYKSTLAFLRFSEAGLELDGGDMADFEEAEALYLDSFDILEDVKKNLPQDNPSAKSLEETINTVLKYIEEDLAYIERMVGVE